MPPSGPALRTFWPNDCVRLGSPSSDGMFRPEKAHIDAPCSVCEPSGFVLVHSGFPFGNGPVTSPANADAVQSTPTESAQTSTAIRDLNLIDIPLPCFEGTDRPPA